MASPNSAPSRSSALPAAFLWATLVVILVAPSQLAYAVHPKDGPFIGYADLLAAVVCLSALLVALVTRCWSRLVFPPPAAWALVVVAALSAGNALQPRSAVVESVQWALYLIAVYMLFVNVLTDRLRLRYALAALTLATTGVVLWGLAQYLTEADPLQVRAGFSNRNTYSAFLAVTLPLLLAVGLHTRRTGWAIWWLALVALGLLTMLSGPLIWVTLPALAWVAFSRSGLRRWVPLAGLAVSLAAAPFVLPRNYQAAWSELAHPYETQILKVPGGPGEARELSVPIVKKRWLEWQPALRMLSANFPLGVGAGNYQINIGQYYEDLGANPDFPAASLPNVKKSEPDTNNLYLVTAGSMGICGLTALVGLLAHFWRRAGNLWSVAEDHLGRGLAAGLPAALLALVIGNLFTAMFVRGLSLVIVLLFALVESTLRLHQGQPELRQSPGV